MRVHYVVDIGADRYSVPSLAKAQADARLAVNPPRGREIVLGPDPMRVAVAVVQEWRWYTRGRETEQPIWAVWRERSGVRESSDPRVAARMVKVMFQRLRARHTREMRRIRRLEAQRAASRMRGGR